MATPTVRNLPDAVHQALRLRAAEHGRSTEEEARAAGRFAAPAGISQAVPLNASAARITLGSRSCTKGKPMQFSTVTVKGQVTIPADLRKQLGLSPGDRVGFVIENGALRLVKRDDRVEAAFGLIQADRAVSKQAMQRAIDARVQARCFT